jgi:hypothetical protein
LKSTTGNFAKRKPAEAGFAGYEFQRHSIVVVDLLDLCPNTFTDLASQTVW